MTLWRNVGLVLLMSAVLVMAQDNPAGPWNRKQIASKEQTKEFTEAFLRSMVTQRPFDAYSMMRAVAPDSEAEIEASRGEAEQLLAQIHDSYGRPIDYEWLDTKSLGQSFIRYDYLLKFERNAVQCRVVYYKPRNIWLPVMLRFNADLGQLFDDLAK